MQDSGPEPSVVKGLNRRAFRRSFFLETLWNDDALTAFVVFDGGASFG